MLEIFLAEPLRQCQVQLRRRELRSYDFADQG
jgi:hypothetical protein